MSSQHLTRVAAFAITMATASTACPHPPAEWGGFGHAFFGGMLNSYGNFENEMAQPRVLGSDFTMSTVAPQFGGGGWVMLAGTFMVGGRGMGFVVDAANTQGASVALSGGGGGLTLGYAAINQDSNLLYPYFGFGGYGFSIEMTNKLASQSIAFGSEAVLADATQTFETGFFAFEFGVGFQRLLFFGDGGFTVGAEGGLLVPVGQDNWRVEGEDIDVSGLEDFGISGGYLRVTLGGGGFIFGDDPSTHTHERAVLR